MHRYPNRRTMLIGSLLLLALLLGTSLAGAAPGPQDVPVWGPNVRANSDNSGYGQHEPHLAVSRTNPNVVVAVAKDYREGNVKHVWIYVSQDGGLTWPLDKQLHMPGLPPDVPLQSDPVTLARDDGRLYAFCLGYNNGHGVFVTWSDDNGDTWHDPSVAITHNEAPGALDDKDWPAIDNFPGSPYYHNMYMAWANGGILFKRSTDGGLTWSTPYTTPAPGDTEYPYPVVARDGTVYLFYMNGWGYGVDGTIEVRKSTNGGVSFGSPTTVAATSQPSSPIHGDSGYDQWRFFSIITAATDPNDPNNLWAAWTDDNNVTDGQTDVLWVRSSDGGSTWSTAARLSDDPPNTGKDHITPVFSAQDVGGTTRLHAFWLDRRADSQNHLFHGYHTATTDGGLTWEPNQQVSAEAFDLNIGFPPGSQNAAGDYWGLDAVGNIVMAAWNTTVRGEQDIYVSRGIYPSGPVTLTGEVSDAVTALPISGAVVDAGGGITTTTGANGLYTLTVSPDVYTVTASAAGYYPQTVPNLGLWTGVVVQDFALQPLPTYVTLTGEVSNAVTTLPIAGAMVDAGGGITTTADAGGLYTLVLESGVYTVTASAVGYYPETVPGLVLVSGTVVQDFALEPLPPVYVTLTGQVTDGATSFAIAGATVDSGGGIITTTDPNGYYTLTLLPGTYTVTASATYYYPESVTLALVSGTVAHDFVLYPVPVHVTLEGQVTDGMTWQPIPGAVVDTTGGFSTTTDANGYYTLTLDPGFYSATASAAGYYSQTYSLELISGTVVQDFILVPLPCPTPTIVAVQVMTTNLTATFSPTVSATGPVNYLWAFGDGVTSTLAVPTHTYTLYGTYPFTLTVTDACGSDTWTGTVILPAPPQQWRLYLPVVFKVGQ